MGILHRLLWHRPRRRKAQSYRKYRAARKRRDGYAARYAAEHPKPSFQATILVNGTEECTCSHDHRTEDAARACGERMAREFRQAPPATGSGAADS